MALSNGGSLLTELSSEHKSNWSGNQPASPDLRAAKDTIRSLIDGLEQLVYKLGLRAEEGLINLHLQYHSDYAFFLLVVVKVETANTREIYVLLVNPPGFC